MKIIPGKGTIFVVLVVIAIVGIYYYGFANETGTVELTVETTNSQYNTLFTVGSTWYIDLSDPIEAQQATIVSTGELTYTGVVMDEGFMYYTEEAQVEYRSNDFSLSPVGLTTNHILLVEYNTGQGVKLFVVHQNMP